MTDFQKWVGDYGGAEALAAELGTVTSGAIYRWLRRERVPLWASIVKLIEVSNGKLTFESILRDTKPRGRGRPCKTKS